MDKIVVLGGSSPFTVEFVDALRRSNRIGPANLVLHGRDLLALDNMRIYAQSRLGPANWNVSATTSLSSAVADARIVLVQVRFGGLEGRAEDEELAARFGLPADETLGPSGLYSALRQATHIRDLAQTLAVHCPNAWIVNLINPISLSTKLLEMSGLRRTVGICELPLYTLTQVAAEFAISPDKVAWSYSGFNHRGFITHAEANGQNLIEALPERLAKHNMLGILPECISMLRAIPLKYFALLTNPSVAASRAEFLMGLRDRIASELRQDPDRRPLSLAERNMPWYDMAVVPIVGALLGSGPIKTTVNVGEGSGCVRERLAIVSEDSVSTLPEPPVSPPVADWMHRFEVQELASLSALTNPTFNNICLALAADPLVRPDVVEEVAAAIISGLPRQPERLHVTAGQS